MSECENKKGNIIVISGFSGAGKGTVLKRVFEMLPHLRWSISATSRKPRVGEVDGKDYYFRTEAEFERLIANDEFVEYTRTFTNYYGTLKSELNRGLENGDTLIMEINVVGALNIKKCFPQAVLLFITPPSLGVLRERLAGRASEDEASLNRRIREASLEIDYIEQYDYLLLNDSDPLDCAKAVAKIIESAESGEYDASLDKYRVSNCEKFINVLKGGSSI